MGYNIDDNVFPERKDLKKKIQENKALYDDIIEQASKIELDKIDYSGEDFIPRSDVKQKQKVFFWTR